MGFGAMDGPKPYRFIGFGAMDGPRPYKLIGFGAIDVTKPYKFNYIWNPIYVESPKSAGKGGPGPPPRYRGTAPRNR